MLYYTYAINYSVQLNFHSYYSIFRLVQLKLLYKCGQRGRRDFRNVGPGVRRFTWEIGPGVRTSLGEPARGCALHFTFHFTPGMPGGGVCTVKIERRISDMCHPKKMNYISCSTDLLL